MADDNLVYSIHSVRMGYAGCSDVFTPCHMKISTKPDVDVAEFVCAGKKQKTATFQGTEGEMELGWIGVKMLAALYNAPYLESSITTSGVATTTQGTAVCGGTQLPTGLVIEAVARAVNTNRWVVLRLKGVSITSPPGFDWEQLKPSSYTFEFYSDCFELLETDQVAVPAYGFDWFATLSPALLYHTNHAAAAYTFGTAPAVAAVCNEASRVSDLVQATTTRQPALIGKKLIFDGVDDNLTNAVISPTITLAATITFVARITETNATVTPQTVLQTNATAVSLGFTDTFVRISGLATNLNFAHGKTWHRYIYVLNGTQHTLYIDGVKIGNTLVGASPNIVALQVGQIGAAATLGMEVAQVGITRVAVTDPAWIGLLDSDLAASIP